MHNKDIWTTNEEKTQQKLSFTEKKYERRSLSDSDKD